MRRVSVCGAQVLEQNEYAARRLMTSQVCICILLLVTVSVPAILWQMLLSGNIEHNDVDKAAIDGLLKNTSVIKTLPGFEDANLTSIKDSIVQFSTESHKGQTITSIFLLGALFVIIPCICIHMSKSALENEDVSRLSCISCCEGFHGFLRCLTWCLPMLIVASACWHLNSDKDILKCEQIVPWVQEVVTKAAIDDVNAMKVGATTMGDRPINLSAIVVTAPHSTFSDILKEIFLANNVTTPFKTSTLDRISEHLLPGEVDNIAGGWVLTLKDQHAAVPLLPLRNVTSNFFAFVFANTEDEQMTLCSDALQGIYKCLGILAFVFTVLACLAGCEVFACCFGSCQAWGARDAFEKNARLTGRPVEVVPDVGADEAKPLMSTDAGPLPPPPIGSNGMPPGQRQDGINCCGVPSWGQMCRRATGWNA